MASTVIYYITYPIEISALSAVLILVGVVAVLKISQSIASRSADEAVTDQPAPLTEGEIKNYMSLADEADIVEVERDDGSVAQVTISYPDGLSSEERRLMRVMAQTNTRPIPMKLVDTVFSGNKVAMQVAVQGLVNKHLIRVHQQHAVLLPSGIQWAHEELKRGLGKYRTKHSPGAAQQEPTLTKDQTLLLAGIVCVDGVASLSEIQEFTKWGMVRVEHVVDQLCEIGLVELTRKATGEQVVKLNKLGRQYVVDKGFDTLA